MSSKSDDDTDGTCSPSEAREIATVREDRKRVRNRIQSLLATQGIRLELRTGFVASLAAVQTGDGRALPAAKKA